RVSIMSEHRNRVGHPTVTPQRRLITPTETARLGVHLPFDLALGGVSDAISPLASDEDRAREENVSSALCTQPQSEFIGPGVTFVDG
ncbi:hypothetical protein ACIODT_39685, partial [Streptomyces sp. NPDC088251]|uniref:hypothetical protein n=1 Tax=unclassified Streptomyces TaxID=2593676 RepID=UPI003817F299